MEYSPNYAQIFGDRLRSLNFEVSEEKAKEISRAVNWAIGEQTQKEIHDWRMHLKPDKELIDLSNMFNPIVRRWINYYGRFYKSGLYPVMRHMNKALVHWARRKHKKFQRHRNRAENWLGKIAKREPKLFAHWQMGILPTAE